METYTPGREATFQAPEILLRRPKTVLFVHAPFGFGHTMAAKRLAAAFKQEDTALNVKDIDISKTPYCTFPLTKFPRLYSWLMSHPQAWSTVFNATNALDITPAIRPFLLPGLSRLLKEESPDLVVSPMLGINGILGSAAKHQKNKPRVEVVLTDWNEIHKSWIPREGGVDHYTAPTDHARKDILGHGTDAPIDIVGIPIRHEFTTSYKGTNRAEVLQRLGLDPDRFTILISVGRSSHTINGIKRLAKLKLDAQLIAVCRSDYHQKQIEQMPKTLTTRTLGFVNNMHDLMRAADVLVTKGGGVTLAEAASIGVAKALYDLLPGQEEGNMRLFVDNKAAVYAKSPEQLATTIEVFSSTPDQLASLRSNTQKLAKPHAAEQIAKNTLSRLG